MDSRTIRLVDVERGDLILVIGQKKAWPVTGLDRIANKVTLDIDDPAIMGPNNGRRLWTFEARDVIGHFREASEVFGPIGGYGKAGCYRSMWSKEV